MLLLSRKCKALAALLPVLSTTWIAHSLAVGGCLQCDEPIVQRMPSSRSARDFCPVKPSLADELPGANVTHGAAPTSPCSDWEGH